MVIPVILETDLQKIKKKIDLVDNNSEIIQIDIADGILVKGKTYLNVDDLDTFDIETPLELHFMVNKPAEFLNKKLNNVQRVCSQIEAEGIPEFIQRAKEFGYQVGLSLAPNTQIKNVEPYLKEIDYVQFVSVEPGGQGREFDYRVMEKIKDFRKKHPDIRVQVDGGINIENMDDVLKAGANDVVIGSAIFGMNNTAQEKNPIVGVTRNATVTPSINTKIKRIAFLGGAAWKPEDSVFKEAQETARLLAAEGYVIINGGGPGVMKAATIGAHEADQRALAVTYHPNKPKRHYEGVDRENAFDEEIITLDYFDRTKVMLQTSELHIIFKGSIGTLSELGMTWISSWIHEPDNKPIILYGEHWKDFLNLMKRDFLLTKGEERMMKICSSPQEVLEYVKSLG